MPHVCGPWTEPRLLLAVVAVGLGAAAVAVVDGTGGGHPEGAVEVVARGLAVELARGVCAQKEAHKQAMRCRRAGMSVCALGMR